MPTVARAAPQAGAVARGAPARVTVPARARGPARRPRPAAGRGAPRCRPAPLGPQLVQIGAFGETDQVSAAMATVEGLAQVRVEPAFAGDRAVARVRLGPVADPRGARCCSWSSVVALGYTDAFMIPASGAGRATLVSC